MKIESYDFGRMIIDGKRYTSDLILLPDRIFTEWWRQEGHNLRIDDLKEVLIELPEVLVIGNGYSGMMNVPQNVIKVLERQNIEVIVEKSSQAVEIYNELFETSGKRIAAAFHLTC